MAKDIGIKPGDVFGKLTVIERAPDYIQPCNGRGKSRFLCECSCPEHNRVIVFGSNLKRGNTVSYGCVHKESARKTGQANKTNGISQTPVAQAYYNMRMRCTNPNYDYWESYGARGITMCPEWADPENGLMNFYNCMAPTYFPGATLDRIDNDGNYEPSNCRWTTQSVQANNTTRSRLITIGDTTYTATEWNRIMGYSKDKVRNRLVNGWTPEEAVFGKEGIPSPHNGIYFVDKFGHPCLDQEYWQKGDFDDSEIRERLK